MKYIVLLYKAINQCHGFRLYENTCFRFFRNKILHRQNYYNIFARIAKIGLSSHQKTAKPSFSFILFLPIANLWAKPCTLYRLSFPHITRKIAELLQRVLDADLGSGIERELIVVNDCSTDSTEQIVEDFIAHHADAPIVYLKHEKNYGKGMAVRTGIRAVTGDYIVMQDADLELDPNDFKKMLPFLLSGEYHVVYGSRFLAEENSHTYFSYQLGGKFLSVMTNILYRQHITDEPTCYKMFTADLLKSIPLDCEGFEFCPEVTAKVSRLGYKIKEVPIRYYPRSIEEGKKLRLSDGLKAIGTLLKYRFWKIPES